MYEVVTNEAACDKEIAEKVMESIQKIIMKAWEAIKKTMEQVALSFANKFKSLVDNPPVGWKRYFKQHELKEYEWMSVGKSNNWRRLRGLPSIRKLKLK